MDLLGEKIEEKEIVGKVLNISERFILNLLKDHNKTTYIDNNYSEKIPDVEYYLIDNWYVVVGKRKIDKRGVTKVDKKIIVSDLDENWFPGEEPNLILIPVDFDLNFGIYIQDSISLVKCKLLEN